MAGKILTLPRGSRLLNNKLRHRKERASRAWKPPFEATKGETSRAPACDTKMPVGHISWLIALAFSTIGFLVASSVSLSQQLWNGQVLEETQTSDIRHISPAPLHSHNDYWREHPLHSAIQHGCIGVEADVWAFGDELYVGHDRGNLVPGYTFSNVYLNPLLEMLRQHHHHTTADGTPRGLYDLAPDQTLAVLVDLKSDAAVAWPILLKKLAALHAGGWLSHVINGTVHTRPITIVVTGSAQLDMVLSSTPDRYVFFDAPLASLKGGEYSSINSYYASVSFFKSIGWVWPGGLGQIQLSRIREQIRMAHERGLKVRYWDAPQWPSHRRIDVWKLLLDEGADVINVDHLQESRRFYIQRG